MASKVKEDDKTIKVDKWDGSALKNALDDAAKLVLTEKMGYVESHLLIDGRLFICTVSVGFALFALLWDYVYPFPQSQNVLIISVLSYFLMMVILTIYTTYKEKGCFLVALEKDKAGVDPDIVWTLSSRLRRYDDMYELYVTCTEAGNTREASFAKSVANYFDENGYLCREIFDQEFVTLHSGLKLHQHEKKTN